MTTKARNYCATFFTKPKKELPEGIRYAVYGYEICPETKKEHWQSYIELNKPMRMTALKKLYEDDTIHFEVRMGTRDQARTYCQKDGKYEEHGKWISGQGHRTDLEDIVDQLKKGTKLSTVMLENPKLYCQYRNGLKDIAAKVASDNIPKFRNVEVILIAGPTGCGKTRVAMEEATYKIQASQLQWWQDYDGDKVITIDEYDNNLPITEMLALLDGYKLRLNVKNSHTYAEWNKVYITTNLRIEQLHNNAKPAHRDALLRRITTIKDYWPKEEGTKRSIGNTETMDLYPEGKTELATS